MLRSTSSFSTRALGSCVLLILAVAATPLLAAVPSRMNYQGYLTDPGNSPLDGTFAMTFKLYPDSTGGVSLWQESYSAVNVVAGVFNVLLGRVTPLPALTFDGSTLWLETTVNGDVLLPRRPLVTVAYSFRSQRADTAQFVAGLPASAISSVQSGEAQVTGSVGSVLNVTIAPVDSSKAFCIVQGTSFSEANVSSSGRLTSSTNLQIRWSSDFQGPTTFYLVWQVIEYN